MFKKNCVYARAQSSVSSYHCTCKHEETFSQFYGSWFHLERFVCLRVLSEVKRDKLIKCERGCALTFNPLARLLTCSLALSSESGPTCELCLDAANSAHEDANLARQLRQSLNERSATLLPQTYIYTHTHKHETRSTKSAT